MTIHMATEHTPTVQVYTDDLLIAQAILKRNEQVSKDYMYRQCYPLFKTVYDNYYTDCTSVYEFIDEIYILILVPNKETGRCQLENYRGESRLSTWLKTTCLFYCYHKYKRKQRMVTVRIMTDGEDGDNDNLADRFIDNHHSTTIDTADIDRSDLEAVISMMSNERYRNIIRLRYLERKTNEETAEALGMTMANYYNKHKLAKAQYIRSLNNESRQWT
ncbi:MAG: sigma-70 family RNA polymerase sigma factor [Bacteroidales bacterium]|nr:sigma-70 family RNA polymerase sigma factor [Bacteroidales bacterium]